MALDRQDIMVWLRGLLKAGIAGSAAAISAGASTMFVVPKEFNFQDGLPNLVKVVGATAIFSFVTGIAQYLKQKPLPEDEVE